MAGIYDNEEIIGAFIDEVEEQLQFLEQGILELEQNNSGKEVIQNIFRVAHTLKGSSAAMGFDKMKILTHQMENVLDKIRNGSLEVTNYTVNVLFQCADHLRMLKEDFSSDRRDIKTDITSVTQALEAVLENKVSEHNDEKVPQTKDDAASVKMRADLSNEQISKIEQVKAEGQYAYICEVKLIEDSFMKVSRACLIYNYFNEIGTIIKTIPNVLEIPDDYDLNVVQYVFTTTIEKEELNKKISLDLMDIEEARLGTVHAEKATSQNLPQQTSKNEDSEKKASHTVRVDVERLEKMMNLVGELVIDQTRIAQDGSILHSRYSSDDTVEDLMGVSTHVSRVISELQETVMKARMLPIQQLFNRFPRMIRDLSQELEKDVELVLDGGETEMDRTIIEEINDPLIHIIRNALDHGIESIEDRIKAFKDPRGKLKITALHQENQVVLTIEDDGKGIDAQAIREAAVSKQIITAQEAEGLSDHEAINLIFSTGFSTARTVSDVSGRGVGMDIVRNHIDKLNGIVDIDTEKGRGTKFTIKLPLTLAILTGLLVKINKEVFAVPMSNVVEIVRMPESQIDMVKGQAVSMIRNRVLPLIWLHDYFNVPRGKKKKNVFIVVLGVSEKRIGLVVDELIGNQEIVVKPLGSYIGKVEGFSGATILGDGSVACILDVVGISKMISNKKVIENTNDENQGE